MGRKNAPSGGKGSSVVVRAKDTSPATPPPTPADTQLVPVTGTVTGCTPFPITREPARFGVVYPLPRVSANFLPDDLREACQAAWELIGHACMVQECLRMARNPFISGTVKEIHDRGTPQERVVREIPPLFAMTAAEAADMLYELDAAYQHCCDRVRPLRSEHLRAGDGYSDGELHATSAHDAAMEYAHKVRGAISFLIRIAAPKLLQGTKRGEHPHPNDLRDNWDVFLQRLGQLPDQFDKLPSASKLQTAIVREAVKAAAARGPKPSRPVGKVPTGTGGQKRKSKPGPKKPPIPPQFAKPMKLWKTFKAEKEKKKTRATYEGFAEWLRRQHGLSLDIDRFRTWRNDTYLPQLSRWRQAKPKTSSD
jgi:hypothetical protein